MTIRPARAADRDALLDIWLRAVRATHAFLSEPDIRSMLPIVRDVALAQLDVSVLAAADGAPLGFMGMSGNRIEALFLDPAFRGRGGGRALVEHAMARHPTLLLDVNEQNPQARAFYERMGFVVEGRSELDTQGRPFPLLHMRWTRR